MKLMLADKPGFREVVRKTAVFFTRPFYTGPKLAWTTFWANMPAAEKARQADNMFVVKQDLNNLANRNLFGQMNFENAEFLMEKLPLIIQDTNQKLARTTPSNIGEKRVLTRYAKSQNQILEEVYAWSTANMPPDPGASKLMPPPGTSLPVQPGETETFPGADKATAKKWFQNPAILIGAGLAAVFLLPKLLNR